MGKKSEFTENPSDRIKFTYRRDGVSPFYLTEYKDYFEQQKYDKPVSYKNASRYKNLRTLKDINGTIHHESWIQQAIAISNSDDEYTKVTLETENRLDMIALQYYGSARYWWVVALANYIIDPFDVPVGTILRIPPLLSLYKSGGVLNG